MTSRIIVTCGDVNGVGLEAFMSAVENSPLTTDLTLACDAQALKDYIDQCSLNATVGGGDLVVGNRRVHLHDLQIATPVELGHMRASSGALAIASLEYAATEVVNGNADGVVTLPISKEGCQLAGFNYPGQTEFFGDLWGGVPLMVLAHENVRVALATVHLPLRSVAARLTPDHLMERLSSLHASLVRDFGIAQPRIAVLALNPHAGEHGAIGKEEMEFIDPFVRSASDEFANSTIEGPFPADGFFGFGTYKNFDGILAMYHDQGLVPLKLLSEGGGVNITAGLKHVRTSPDHGTAYAIAGKGL